MTPKGVEESTKGNMPKGEGPNTPSTESKTPESVSKVSPEPEAYTKETEETAVQKALSAAGRVSTDTAEATRLLEAAKQTQVNLQTEQKRWQDDRDEASRVAVAEDSEALKSLNEQIRQRKVGEQQAEERATMDAETATHQTKVAGDLETIRVFNRTERASEVAVAKGGDDPKAVKSLLDSILKLAKDDTREAMETVADLLKGRPDPLLTVSGKAAGGKMTEQQRLDKLYPSMAKKS